MEYKLLDSGNWQKLEQVGKYRLVRPALNAAWQPARSEKEWKNVDGIFTRNSSGGGKWNWLNRKIPESWSCEWGGINIIIKPTNFGHLGFFAEQYSNWTWQRAIIKKLPAEAKVLNMFAYSGCGSMAMAQAGAKVTHLDAARGMIEWGKEIQQNNSDVPNSIRWIVDDVKKFVAREVRRGSKYNGIVLDPPSFGRGANGQVWKIEKDLNPLLTELRKITDLSKPFFVLLSCHSTGYSPIVLSRLLTSFFPEFNTIESGEMTIPEINSEKLLPAGIYARITG